MKKRILVIDDDVAVRKSFALGLEDFDYEVEMAETGDTGLEKFRGKKHDLIFLDLKMPGINGAETLKRIREIDRDVPVYIVTAFHADFLDELKSASKAGVDFQLLRKPIRLDEIALIVESVFKGPLGY